MLHHWCILIQCTSQGLLSVPACIYERFLFAFIGSLHSTAITLIVVSCSFPLSVGWGQAFGWPGKQRGEGMFPSGAGPGGGLPPAGHGPQRDAAFDWWAGVRSFDPKSLWWDILISYLQSDCVIPKEIFLSRLLSPLSHRFLYFFFVIKLPLLEKKTSQPFSTILNKYCILLAFWSYLPIIQYPNRLKLKLPPTSTALNWRGNSASDFVFILTSVFFRAWAAGSTAGGGATQAGSTKTEEIWWDFYFMCIL